MAKPASYYKDGQWSTGTDLLMEAWTDDLHDQDVVLKRLGYESFTEVGIDSAASAVTLKVYRRDASPRFLVEVWGPEIGEYVYAEHFHDAMGLLERWTPVVQAAAVAEVLDRLSLAAGKQVTSLSDLIDAI
ncbi:hypothetical protein ACSNOI_46070 [Actinomadura kijaniata]|uniref:hypothetical protein n=1 Tax=Actinomadura kijaniata TaxID=46161 RepID=UPI003F1C8DCE